VLWEDFLPGNLNSCLMMLNLIQKFLRDFNETFTEYSLYSEVYRNYIDFILIAELGVAGLEAALNTQTGHTFRTPNPCLLLSFL
jgi:hypothetical protein